jgi:triacylglycerol lipase
MTFPIVLAHGVCRFDIIWNSSLRFDNNDDPCFDNRNYFKGVRSMLRATPSKNYEVYHSNVSWGAGVKQRARDLKENIIKILDESGALKVNIIAHSMGGLDARHMMFNDRNDGKIHERIASLTTISTPHWGSPFADWLLKHFPNLLSMAGKMGVDLNGLRDLRVKECSEFNQRNEVQDFEGQCEKTIQFRTYAGRQNFMGVLIVLKPSFYIIEWKEGENDGLVSVSSAKWKEKYFKGFIEDADHLNELGWWDPGQITIGETPRKLLERIHALYADIAARLP